MNSVDEELGDEGRGTAENAEDVDVDQEVKVRRRRPSSFSGRRGEAP